MDRERDKRKHQSKGREQETNRNNLMNNREWRTIGRNLSRKRK
jgi:hypothetical protein